MSVQIRRSLCLLLVLFFLLSPAALFPAAAQAETELPVIETNIGIQPSDYKK